MLSGCGINWEESFVTSGKNQLAVTTKRMSNSSFDSANSNASSVSSWLQSSNIKEECESDAVATELSDKNVVLYKFELAAAGWAYRHRRLWEQMWKMTTQEMMKDFTVPTGKIVHAYLLKGKVYQSKFTCKSVRVICMPIPVGVNVESVCQCLLTACKSICCCEIYRIKVEVGGEWRKH